MPIPKSVAETCGFYKKASGFLCSEGIIYPEGKKRAIVMVNRYYRCLQVNTEFLIQNPDCCFWKTHSDLEEKGRGTLVYTKAEGVEHSVKCRRFGEWLFIWLETEHEMKFLLAELGIPVDDVRKANKPGEKMIEFFFPKGLNPEEFFFDKDYGVLLAKEDEKLYIDARKVAGVLCGDEQGSERVIATVNKPSGFFDDKAALRLEIDILLLKTYKPDSILCIAHKSIDTKEGGSVKLFFLEDEDGKHFIECSGHFNSLWVPVKTELELKFLLSELGIPVDDVRNSNKPGEKILALMTK